MNPLEMSGLDLLRAAASGDLPGSSMGKTIPMSFAEVDSGYVMMKARAGSQHLNPLGGVHGGWALTLIDSATGCAAHTLLPAGVGYATVETKANFTRPIKHDTGRVRAEGRVVGRGRQIMSAEARIVDAAGRILSHGTSTLMVFNGAAGKPANGS